MERKAQKKWKKKAAVGVVAAATSASVLVGGAFDSPVDLLDAGSDGNSPTPVIQTLTAQTADMADDGGAGDDDGNDEERRQRFPAVRRWMAGLPAGVRALVGVPLWCVGWGVTTLLSLLWQAALTPLGGRILAWVLTAAAAALVFALTAKALFPNVPWKKLLRPRNILPVVLGVVLLGGLDTVLTVFWDDYPPIGQALRLIGGAVMIVAACLATGKLFRRRQMRSPEPETEPEDAPAAPRTAVERQAMALADSVCAPSVPRP